MHLMFLFIDQSFADDDGGAFVLLSFHRLNSGWVQRDDLEIAVDVNCFTAAFYALYG